MPRQTTVKFQSGPVGELAQAIDEATQQLKGLEQTARQDPALMDQVRVRQVNEALTRLRTKARADGIESLVDAELRRVSQERDRLGSEHRRRR